MKGRGWPSRPSAGEESLYHKGKTCVVDNSAARVEEVVHTARRSAVLRSLTGLNLFSRELGGLV